MVMACVWKARSMRDDVAVCVRCLGQHMMYWLSIVNAAQLSHFYVALSIFVFARARECLRAYCAGADPAMQIVARAHA